VIGLDVSANMLAVAIAKVPGGRKTATLAAFSEYFACHVTFCESRSRPLPEPTPAFTGAGFANDSSGMRDGCLNPS
jgi:hypothetical protein